MSKGLTLDVAMVTHRPEGIGRVASMDLPCVEGVRYVVSWQAHGDAPVPDALAARDDVEIHRLDCSGQSHNRNNALSHCRADLILNSDDDLIYTAEGLRGVIRAFEESPEVDVATFISRRPGAPVYPAVPTDLHDPWPKGYDPATFDMAVRRATAGRMRFCPELGLGSPRIHGAEDTIYLFSAIKRGYRCRFFPVEVCRHPGESTGCKERPTADNLRASGCAIALMWPATAALRVPLKAWRVSRAGRAPLLKALRYIAAGALAAPALRRRNPKTLW